MKIIGIASIVFICICFISCSKQDSSQSSNPGRKGEVSVYKDQVKIIYAKNFDIEYLDSAKIIRVYSPGKEHKLIARYVLLTKTAPIPHGYEGAQIIRIPVQSVIALSTIYIGFLDKLGLTDKVIAVDNVQYINSPKVWQLINAKKISEVGDSFNMNIEKVFVLKPDLVLTTGNGDPNIDGSSKLIQSGIHFASSILHLENSPLARTEWIKFVAVFFNYEKEANAAFNEIVEHYNKLKSLTENIPDKPTVFTEALLGGVWYEPGGNSYMAQLLNDAGANYPWKHDPSTGSLKLSFEQVYEKAYNADYWVNVHFWSKINDALKNDVRNSKFKAWKTKNIYNYNQAINKFGYYEYWENGIINCDQVLADLIKIFHPELLPEHKFKYYRKLSD